MFCSNCGKELDARAVACPACGVPPRLERKFCFNCGTTTAANQAICTKCGVSLTAGGSGEKNKVAAGLLAIFLGALGIHKFYLGYSKEGVIMLLITIVGGVFTFSIASWVMAIIALIEGITYLTKPDAEFANAYVRNKRGWF